MCRVLTVSRRFSNHKLSGELGDNQSGDHGLIVSGFPAHSIGTATTERRAIKAVRSRCELAGNRQFSEPCRVTILSVGQPDQVCHQFRGKFRGAGLVSRRSGQQLADVPQDIDGGSSWQTNAARQVFVTLDVAVDAGQKT